MPCPSEWVCMAQVEAFWYFKTLTLLSGTLIPHPRLVLLNSGAYQHSWCNVDKSSIAAYAHYNRTDVHSG